MVAAFGPTQRDDLTAALTEGLRPILYGHRVTELHTPETLWCEGGGRSV